MDPLLFILGLAAGALTTVAGMGGGLLLLAVLGLRSDPHTALAWVTPALLIGNLHRVWLYRAEVDRRVAGRVLIWAGPPSLLAALLATWVPGTVLALLVGALALLGLLQGLSAHPPLLPPRVQGPVAALCGAVSATGGGAGVLLGPVLLSAGLRARPYVASMAAVAVGLHFSRLIAFGATGLMTGEALRAGALLALSIMLGNRVGDRLLGGLDPRWEARVQSGALAACALVAITEAIG